MPLSGKEMRSLFERAGYVLIAGGGKGSHWKLRKGNKTVIVPSHKELKKGTEYALKKALKGEK